LPKLGHKSADELAQIALRHHRSGSSAQAERSYRAALERTPRHVASLTLLSTLLLERREYAEAAALLERATQAAPQLGILHSNLGEALRRLDRKEEALRAFQRAVDVSPELAEAHYNLGLLLDQLGRLPEAIAAYETALELKPHLPEGLLTLLKALRDNADYARAIVWYRRLAPRLPDSCELRCAVAGAMADIFRLDEALEHLDRALEMDPASARAHADYASTLAERGEIDAALEHLREAIAIEPQSPIYHSNLVYLLPFSSEASSVDVRKEAENFGRRHADILSRSSSYPNVPNPIRRLRVGYVSADFRTHPVALFLLPLLREHDRACVEVFCYSNVRRPDGVTAELRLLADVWRDISLLDDDSAASVIREDAIDILVDLSQHSAGQRLLLFARRPAPVQISWLGYPGTTGVAAIDYRITDPRLDPPELGNESSTEKLIWLPQTFWCYSSPSEEPAVNELPALANGHISFGNLNSFKKTTDVSLALWLKVLEAVPGSRLVLVTPAGHARDRVRRMAASHGVDPGRLELVGHLPRPDYLRTYQRLDVCLDPVPYNGGTTTLDALWMGVPVVTLCGATAVSRAGSSLLHHMQLTELITTSADEYVTRAVVLASDLQRLAQLRQDLRSRLKLSPLFATTTFARHLESLFQTIWQSWCHSDAKTATNA
jgi:protein O-GlcNAc transferase